MRDPAAGASAMYDGVGVGDLARRCGVPRVVALTEVASTLDVAHALAEVGAASGTLVLADGQTSGRGQLGRRWESPTGGGIWLTLLERAVDADAVGVLSLRLGMAAAPVLDAFAVTPVLLKLPNDLYLASGKVGGILVEARWQAGRLMWVAVGIGLNAMLPAGVAAAAALRPGTRRAEVVERLVPALRRAVAATGQLRPEERDAFAARDVAAHSSLAREG